MEKGRSLNTELLRILIGSMILVAVLLLAGSTLANSKQYRKFYNDKALEIAKTTADQIDGDFIEHLCREMDTEEFAKVKAAVEETEDEQLIKDWLAEKNMYEDYKAVDELLHTVQTDMDIEYLYIQVIRNNSCMYLFDPGAAYLSLGYVEELTEEFENLNGNERLEPTVSRTELGWLSSGGEPVVTSSGEKCAVVFVDINMTEIVKNTIRFTVRMICLCIVVVFLAGILVSKRIQKRISLPVEQLTEAADSFGDGGDGYDKRNIVELDIHTGDEIEKLYHATRFMQESIIDYMENLKRVTAEKERIGAELNVATQIQADMLPRIFPAFPGRREFDIYATMTPAKEVGGDFYDFFLIDDDHLAMVMADVSGKGVPAALFMVIAKTLIKNQAQMDGSSPAKILMKVNEQLCEGNEAEMFVTVWLAILDISTGKGVAANAGHEHPALRRAGGQYELVIYRHSPAVATMEGIRFRDHEFKLEPGDSLYVYTDGVAEAANADDELFGTERMLEALNRNPEAGTKELLENVKEAVDIFVGAAPQFDDITMLCIKYDGP